MTTTKPAAPLDLDQFDGHTPGPWAASHRAVVACGYAKPVAVAQKPKDALLLAASLQLLSECRRLRASEARLREALECVLAGTITAKFLDSGVSHEVRTQRMIRAALAATGSE